MRLDLPAGYVARPYRGRVDHALMAALKTAAARDEPDAELSTAEQFDASYPHLERCDLERDVAIVETSEGEPAAYLRTAWDHAEGDSRVWHAILAVHPDHRSPELLTALVGGWEAHVDLIEPDDGRPSQLRAWAPHPGGGLPEMGLGAALVQAGFTTTRFGASLVRPHLDDIPDYVLPAGVEMRPVEPHHLHQIWATDHEAFRGQPDFVETDESQFQSFLADPLRDETLWKIAWAGDGLDAQVVGQVKSFINAEENRLSGRLRGYTEFISTTLGWRGKGIARALIVASLHELKARGMTEAALGADTDNPQAFDLYRMLGFEVIAYQAQYDKPRGQVSIVS
jgi:ribosomal protein S18 acetylase RimI-like enzyme